MDHSSHNRRSARELVTLAQSGDWAAFDELAARFRAAVLAVTFSRTGNRDLAEDLAQDVMVKVRTKLPELRDPAAFPGWLKAVALNECRNWYRRSRPWPESLDGAFPEIQARELEPLDALLARERQKAWRAALLKLPDANRLALLMHVWGDLSYEEIAAFAEVPVTTIEGRIHRSKVQLRRILASDAAELLGEPRRKWRKENSDDKR